MKDVLVFSKTHCPACLDLKKALTDSEIPFTEVNVEVDTMARQELMDAGFRSVPQVMMDDEWVKDFMEIFE